MLTSGIQLPPLSVDIVADTAGLERGLDKTSSISISKVESMGKSLSAAGDKMTKYLTVPLLGAGVAATKVGMDFESQMSRVKAISGATGKEFEALQNQAIQLGADTAFSANEAAQGMENLASAGFTTSEIMKAMPGMMDLAASSGEDLASSADIAASTLRGFNLEADKAGHVADVLAKNAADTNAAVADTGEAMKYVAPIAYSMGLSLEEVTAAIGELANAGIKGSQAGTTIRSALTSLAKPSNEAATLMKNLGFEAFDANGKLYPLKDIIGNLNSSLSGLTAEQKQNAVATIFGTEAMSGMLTLINAGPEELETLTESLKNSDGAAKEMAKTMQDNAKSSVEEMFGALESATIKVEKSIAPMITKVANAIGDVADKFSNLSEEQQGSIIKFAAFAMAIGPTFKILGGGIETVVKLQKGFRVLTTAMKGTSMATSALATTSSITAGASGLGGVLSAALPLTPALVAVGGAIYMAKENSDFLNRSLATTSEELSLGEKFWNNMHGGLIKSKEEMENLGLVYKDWSNNVAPNVAESVDKTAEAWRNLNFELDYLETNDILIDESKVANLKSQTDKICSEIIQEIKENQSESTKALSEYFNVDNTLDTYENTVLSFFNSNGEKQVAIVQTYQAKINDLYATAAAENRKLYESETIAIEEYQAKINQAKIDALSTNQDEYLELQANFNVKMRNLDLEGASELLQEKAQLAEDDLASTNEYYDTKIEMLKMNLDNMNTQERIAAEEQIRKLEEDKEAKVKSIKDTYSGYLEVIKEKYPEIYARIDTEEGKILSVQEKADKEKLIKALASYNDLDSITQSGMQRIYNTESQAYEDVYVMVDEKTGNIVGTWNKSKDKITGTSEEIRSKLIELTEQYNVLSNDQKNRILDMIVSNTNYDESTRTMATSVASLLQGTGEEIEGLYTEVVNLNGTPVRVQVNSDGTIANIESIINKINSIPKITHSLVVVDYKDSQGNNFSASKYYSDGRGGYYLPNYNYNGKDYVPYDGYTARLHKGERVLTAKENEQYTNNINNNNIASGEIVINNNMYLDGEVAWKNQDRISGTQSKLQRRMKGL